ncbi:MAG: MFS transporter, partial [Peptostreptococcus porci]|nr:MFS transporter [Peptostreptococcus porci]
MTEVEKKGFGGHPKGLLLASVATGMSSYLKYAIAGFTVLFYTLSVKQGGLGLDRETAGMIIAVSGSVGSIIPLLGSVITDRYLGIQKGMMLSFLLSGIGYLFIYLFSPNVTMVIVGLTINIIAAAFMNNNITAIVGMLYSNKDLTKKDAAYSIFYMAVNIGSMFGPIIGGLISDKWMAVTAADGTIVSYGYKYVYLMAAVGM